MISESGKEGGAAMTDRQSVLTAEGLVKSFKRRRVVDQVHLEVRQGEVVGLLGPNGAGKTTTFYMMVGLLKPDSGRASVFRKLTVEQNVRAILETLKLDKAEREERLDQLLDELSIKHLRKSKAYSLSGGERRRLEITRALVTDPKFMLLDEPFTGVDPIAIDDIQRIVGDLRDKGLGVLITDHNVRETLSITDRAYLLYDGKILIEGKAEELVNNPEARKLYLGEGFRM
jgi:lipopolysaccharide export system ATP-binding protein